MRTLPHVAAPSLSRTLFALLLLTVFIPPGAGRPARAQASAATVGGAAARQQPKQAKPTPRPKKKTRAQEIHDLGVLAQAHLRRYQADMNSSQEYAKRGDQVQADAMKLNADNSRKKAEKFKRQLDALLKGGKSRRKH